MIFTALLIIHLIKIQLLRNITMILREGSMKLLLKTSKLFPLKMVRKVLISKGK